MSDHTYQFNVHGSMRDQREEISLRDVFSRLLEDNKE